MTIARDEKDIVEMFEAQFTRSEDKFSTVKKNWKEENNFSLGEQWDASTKSNRSQTGKERPCLTINKIDPLVHRIVNEAKQNSMSGTVKPVDDGSDPDTALILGGLIRNIEYVSNAVRAYMWAYECAVRAGLGYFKVVNQYEDDDSFDQTVRIKRIKNPLCVSFDPDSEEQCGRDATVGMISDEISKIAADNLCKGVEYDSSNISPKRDIWLTTEGSVRHGEIYWEESEPDTLYKLKDGSYMRKSAVDKQVIDMAKEAGIIVAERKVPKKTIMFANLVEAKVIEKSATNSKYIPIVRVVGREGYIDGKIDYRGITRNSMDSNRMYNVMSSLLVERIGLAPRAPFIAAAGQIEGYQQQWLNSNNENIPVLEYNMVTLGGNLAPPPQKNDAPSGDATIERYMSIASNDIKDTSQLSDAFMGNKSNETSGAGIKARASQSGLATFDFQDNIADSIEHGNRIALDMIPRIMSEKQQVRIMGEDYTEKIINLGAYTSKNGETKKINLSVGKFDVEVKTESGDKTRREAAIEQLSFVLQTNPDAASLIMDVFVGNLDIKDASKIAKRFKAMLPPQVIAAEEESEKDNPELDAFQQHAEQIISKMKAQLQEAIAKLQDAEMKLKDKTGELNIKQQEVDIKKQEAKTKELETISKLESDKESGKETPEQVGFLIHKMKNTEEELEQMHKELEIVTHLLETLMSKEKTEQLEPTQPDVSSTQGNGLPPAEAENNVGEI